MGDDGGGGGNGRRWYDPNRIVLALGGIVALMVFAWGGAVWGKASAAETANVRQDEQITTIQKRLDSFDSKLDRIYERVK